MHGCDSVSALFVNAEVDSMGGVIDGGVGIGLKTSPRRAAIEKAQAELRQEYDVREERRRELEFLEKGGNPLDFKFGNASSVSVQSTSLTDQHHDLCLNSEAKGSVALTASPHGDSVDSSARPGAVVSEPNTADNLLLFEGENELPEGDKRSLHLNKRNNVARSEQSSRIDGCQNAKDSEDSAIFRPYERRNRSRTNHASRGGSRDGKGLISDKNNQKDHNLPSVSKPKSLNVNGDRVTKDPKTPLDNDLHGVQAHQTGCGNGVPADKLNITFTINSKEDQRTVLSQDDTAQNPFVMDTGEANAVEEREPITSADTEVENENCSGLQNGFGNVIDSNGLQNQGQNNGAVSGMKNFESETSVQANLGRDIHSDSDMHANTDSVEANESNMEQTLEFTEKQSLTGCEVMKEKNDAKHDGIIATVSTELDADHQNHSGGDKAEENKNNSNTLVQNEVTDSSNTKEVQHNDHILFVGHLNSNQDNCCGRPQAPIDASNYEFPQAEQVSTATSDCQPCSSHHVKLSNKAHEDSILEEAQTIEAKRKRIAELSICVLPTQDHLKSHWDFVLEEMAWLANDFAQERIWKINAAAQLCHQAALMSRLRFEEKNKNWGIKTLAHTMAKAVMQFWHSVELLDNADPGINCIDGTVESGKVDTDEASSDKRRKSIMMLETSKDLEGLQPRRSATKLQAYALRFLKNNRSRGASSQAVAPTTPDRLSDSGTMDMSWEDHLTEESLFYTVPSNAMETYRKSVESHFLQCEKTGTSIQGESETIMYDTVTEFGPEEIGDEEDEVETGAYYLPSVYEVIKSSKSVQKKHKHMIKSHIPRSCEVGSEVPCRHYATGAHQSMLIGKRPASLNVGPIRKRMRTASRQRVVSPFTAGITGAGQAQARNDASSGDTNSFQDDQSTLHGGSHIQKSVEVDSVGDFEKQLPYECAETSFKTKKKKKAKNLGSAYDHGWQLDSTVLNEQRDHYHKRLESHHFESNGSSGLYGQHNAKKLKIMKQPTDNTLDNLTPMTGSIPSPAASQMSNMPNQSKFIRIISGRDRGRKSKTLKISAGQPGLGSPWSLFEDQALVVLVHDMGPNWELVSDAINSALQFKCIFRKPKECKERHKILMDKSSGDGADSAEDSGSSQSYPSTLPGIPKGSARQLFQRLQGPMEEDTLKSHFEKIIRIGHKLPYRRNQNENQDFKQTVNVHNSHVFALSQVYPNNLGGDPLTPLDLCDSNASTPDIGYQGSHPGAMALSSQGSVPSLPTSGINSSLAGSSGMVLGGNLSSTSGSIATSVRDNRFGVTRGSIQSVDEQQRMQQSNPVSSGRNHQQFTMPVTGSLSGSDRGVRMLPGGNNMGMVGGISRSGALARPGFQGMASSSVLTSGSMHSTGMVGMPSPVNMHSGVGTAPGNSIPRPHEAIHMMRPGHNSEPQRQMTVPELQMQVTQANSPGVAAFSGLSSAFCNQTTQPPIQPYTGHAQQPHQMSQQQSHLSNSHSHVQGPNHTASSQHQAYAMRLAKERQLQQQQRYLQHQQQFAASNAMMPQVQSQSQIPISSALQNNSQVQSQNSSQQVSLSPVTPSSPLTPMSSHHQQQKHHLPQHGFNRNPGASVLTNQSVKQRQRQPQQQQYQQPSRQHPNQRQTAQSQQQAKLLKGMGRGNMVHQNLAVDPSHLNGLSMPPGNQTAEKGDSMHMMQGQNVYPGSGVNAIQSPKPLASAAHSSSYSQLPQKLHSGSASNSKQNQPLLSPDCSAQAQVLPVTSGHILSLPQATGPPTVASNHNQMQLQSQPQSKQINQTQSNVQRMLQQNRQMHSESPSRSQSDPAQVDQQPSSQISTSCAMTQGCVETANVVPAFSTVSPQWKISEPPYDSNMPNLATQVGPLGSAPAGNSAGNESLPIISQGLGLKQISVSLPSHAHNSGAQWQHQPALPHQQSLSQPILPQQPYQSQEHQKEREQHSPRHGALHRQPQQQIQHLQPGQGVLFTSPPNPNSKAE